MSKFLRLSLLAFGLLSVSATVSAQDAFFVHFFNNRSYFNPALTGWRGAMSLDAKFKSQWGAPAHVAYETYGVSYEESVPCAWFDYGLHFYSDREGDGVLTTNEFGGSLAGTIVLAKSRTKGSFNARGGLSFFLGQKRIDFSRLVFSDQLDRKYGLFDANGTLNPTSFNAPGGGESAFYLMPKLGLTLRYAAGQRRNNPPGIYLNSLQAGGSVHNVLGLFDSPSRGQITSLLNLDASLAERWAWFVEAEWALPFASNRNYFAFSPLLLQQRQGRLDYWEAGGKITFSRNVGFGAYYHFSSDSDQGTNTSWLNLVLEFGGVLGSESKHRVDFGVAYANNFSGLQNIVGPILEFSMTYSLRRSNFCKWTGRQNELGGGPLCPVSPSGKIYEPIW